jgi:hypothetical protein
LTTLHSRLRHDHHRAALRKLRHFSDERQAAHAHNEQRARARQRARFADTQSFDRVQEKLGASRNRTRTTRVASDDELSLQTSTDDSPWSMYPNLYDNFYEEREAEDSIRDYDPNIMGASCPLAKSCRTKKWTSERSRSESALFDNPMVYEPAASEPAVQKPPSLHGLTPRSSYVSVFSRPTSVTGSRLSNHGSRGSPICRASEPAVIARTRGCLGFSARTWAAR